MEYYSRSTIFYGPLSCFSLWWVMLTRENLVSLPINKSPILLSCCNSHSNPKQCIVAISAMKIPNQVLLDSTAFKYVLKVINNFLTLKLLCRRRNIKSLSLLKLQGHGKCSHVLHSLVSPIQIFKLENCYAIYTNANYHFVFH